MIPLRFPMPLIEPRPQDYRTTREYVHARNVYLKQIKDRQSMDNWDLAAMIFLLGAFLVAVVSGGLALAYVTGGVTGVVVLLTIVGSVAWCIFEIKQYLDRKDQDNGS